MAQVIQTEKKNANVYGAKKQKKSLPLFGKMNYILMIIGVVILFVGYVTLTGGGSEDPTQFSEALFSTSRMVVAPILMLVGLVLEIVAIMYHPRSKKNTEETPKAE